jgi:predicted TPR repeat methyltransferase
LEGAALAFREAIKARLGHAPAWQNLGNVLRDLGRPGEAVDAFWEALRLAPQSADSYRQLGAMLASAGRIDKAIEVHERWLEIFPDDPRAKHFLAALTQEKVPDRASDDYVRTTFDIFAANFDNELAELEYRAPALIDEEVARLCGPPQPRMAVLDAGCGTGLCAPFLRPRASHLAGVDLSPAMIEKAGKRGLFDALAVEELTAHLRGHAAMYDLIVSADTLVYFGDLGEVTLAAARALRPGGAFVFTVERANAEDAPAGFRINPHGRYGHTRDYLLRSLTAAGLIGPEIRKVDLRKEADQWVAGWLCSAKVGQLSVRPNQES